MRIRQLSPSGDMLFGQGQANYLVDSSQGVGQLATSRLELITGEYFLDQTAGTPYPTQVLGVVTQSQYDLTIRSVISETQGFQEFVSYSSQVNTTTRALTIATTINTIYGQSATVEVSL